MANQTLQISPNDAQALNYLAIAKAEGSKPGVNNAKTNMTPENYLNLSLFYYQAGQYEKSITAANEALKLKPDYAEAYNNICAAYNGLKQWDKAISAAEAALRLKSDFTLAKNNLAWALEQKKKSASANTRTQ
jgi:tetratricopeptide (TPR) repeat protein